MDKNIDTILGQYPSEILTDSVVDSLFQGSADRKYGLVKRAIARGRLKHICRGVYVLAQPYQRGGINMFALAQFIYGPSYISFESALAYHGWIPEAVYLVKSACMKRSKMVETSLGRFQFCKTSSTMFYGAVNRVSFDGGSFLMAEPWKALTDYIYYYKKNWLGMDPLIKSLRIDRDYLAQNVRDDYFDQLALMYKSKRVKNFLDGIKKDLQV